MLARKQILLIISIISINAISIALLISHLFPKSVNILSEDMVEAIIVHYEDGTNMTVRPSTLEGKSLTSACSDWLESISGRLGPYVSEEGEAMPRACEIYPKYVEVVLKNTYNLTLYYGKEWEFETVPANRIFFIIIDGFPVVAISPSPYVWGYWHVSARSGGYLKLVNIVNSMHTD